MQTPQQFPHQASQLVDAVRFLGARGWCPATGGNFSTRVDNDQLLITRSGCDKRHLSVADLMLCNPDGTAQEAGMKPSAETALHARLYQLDHAINCVLHVHTTANTLLSRHCPGSALTIQGFEMQKALSGQTTHEASLAVPVFDNTQDMDALADTLHTAWQQGAIQVPGFLVRGHGLYAWGGSISEAKRHVEGFEFLFNCLWQEQLMGVKS